MKKWILEFPDRLARFPAPAPYRQMASVEKRDSVTSSPKK
jgi:hypothetical protein